MGYHIIKCSQTYQKMKRPKRTAGAVILQTGSTITEKEQLLCNTHLSTICQIMIKSFHQPGTGHREIVEVEFHPEIDTR